jgi:adenylate cyclase
MTADECPENDVHRELERVLASPGFARNARMSRFLGFLVRRHLEGRDDELKESLIAIEVFGRRPDYDPRLDSIVRTEAARLRSRLAEYYASHGRLDPLTIEVPKGGYVPVCRPRQADSKGREFRLRHALTATVLACCAAAAVAGGWRVLRQPSAVRIAVLPLENLSADASAQYFADGLTDEIIGNLSVIEGLAVRSRTSSFAVEAGSGDAQAVGRALRAEYLLEGSVLREGDRLRINARLIRARDDFSVWSGRFERPLTDIFAIQNEMATQMVNSLRLQLGRGRRRYETSVEAYDLYLRARARSFEWRHPDVIDGVRDFEQAIARDPTFAPAYAGLSSVYAIHSAQFAGEHASDELAKMESAATKAIDLDPLLAEAHAALALAYARRGRWDDAERSFRRAMALDRNRSRTFIDFAMWMLYPVGRTEEAFAQLRTAEAADPLSSEVQASLAWLLMSFGRYDQAEARCAKTSTEDPLNAQCLGRVRLGQGRLREAVQILTGDPNLADNPQARGFLGLARARLGERAEAERMAERSAYANEQALIYAGLGDRDRTLAALERMEAAGPQRVGRYLNYPELALLRGDPRLPAFRRRIGLPE